MLHKQEKDERLAVACWERAVEANYAKAELRLGLAYANGRGVERDLSKAFHW